MCKERHPDIAAMEHSVVDQRQKHIAAIRAVQAKCPHDKIVESGGNHPRRICCVCGLEEVIRYFSWPSHTIDGGYYEFVRPAGQPTILNSEYIKQGDVTQYRVQL